jgi:hypothetical protein
MSSFPSSQSNGRSGSEIVTLIDDTGRSLDCLVEKAIKQGDAHYYLLMPIDAPVTIIVWDDEKDADAAIWLEEESEISEIFADAQAVLAEFDLTLKRTAYTLTVEGEIDSIEDEEILTIEIEEPNGEIESEEFRFLVNFFHERQEYEIYTPLTPLLFLAKGTLNGQLELLSKDELNNLQPLLGELLFEEFDG